MKSKGAVVHVGQLVFMTVTVQEGHNELAQCTRIVVIVEIEIQLSLIKLYIIYEFH